MWEAGRRAEAVAAFDAALRPWTKAIAFGDADFLLHATVRGDFESTVVNLLTATLPNSAETLLQVPFARAWAGLFALDPQPRWLDLWAGYDFHQAPTAEGFDEQDFAPPQNHAADYTFAAQELLAAARAGVLVPVPPRRDGRPVLVVADVGVELAEPLSGLADAYAAAPSDFWSRRLAEDPRWVAAWFAHDLVGRHGAAAASVAARWHAAKVQQPEYAEAGLASLAKVDDADDFVTVEVGRVGGRVWLDGWLRSLEAGDGAPPA